MLPFNSKPEGKLMSETLQKNTITAGIPLRQYRFTLRYPLLLQLGEISQFFLSAVAQLPMNEATFCTLTGLSLQQVEPIVQRLAALDLLAKNEAEGWQLSGGGERLLYIKTHMHEKSVQAWLDAEVREAPVLVKPDSQRLSTEAIPLLWKNRKQGWPRDKAKKDVEQQKVRLTQPRYFETALRWLFPAFADLAPLLNVAADRASLSAQAWQLEVSRLDGLEACLPVSVTPIAHAERSFSLLAAVTILESYYRTPAGLHGVAGFSPAPQERRYFSHLEQRIVSDLKVESEKQLVEEFSSEQQAAAVRLLTESSGIGEQGRFNREWRFFQAQQRYELLWPTVLAALPVSDDLYCGGR